MSWRLLTIALFSILLSTSPAAGVMGVVPPGSEQTPGTPTSPNASSVFQWQDTRATLGIGPAWLVSDASPYSTVDFTLRYRLTPQDSPWPHHLPNRASGSVDPRQVVGWYLGPLPLWLSLEAGGIPPVNSSSIEGVNKEAGPTRTDTASQHFRYAMRLGLVDELPHGKEAWVIPEVGAGASIVHTKVQWSTFDTSGRTGWGEDQESSLEPYIEAGLHFFPEHIASLLLEATYVRLPDTSFLLIRDRFPDPSVSHTQDFGFPSSAWLVGLTLQIKLVWPHHLFAAEPPRAASGGQSPPASVAEGEPMAFKEVVGWPQPSA